jgi:hypothetical protein
MKLYRIDIQICATAYIKATSKTAAMTVAKGLKDSSPDILDSCGDVPVSGAQFDDPDMPKVSLSPAMTIHGVWPGTNVERCDR